GPRPRLQRLAQARRAGAEVLDRRGAQEAQQHRDEDGEVEDRPEEVADRRVLCRVLRHAGRPRIFWATMRAISPAESRSPRRAVGSRMTRRAGSNHRRFSTTQSATKSAI